MLFKRQQQPLDILFQESALSSPIKLVKLKVEGAEPEILKGSLDTLVRTMCVSADIGPERGLEKASTLIEVNLLLTEANFEMIDYAHACGVILYKNKLLVS
jgi:hypothetical protein